MKYDIKEIKNFLIDELVKRKGKNIQVYSSYLPYIITENINCDGAIHYSTSNAIQFIKDNFDFMGEVVEYHEHFTDISINPFLEPDKAKVLAYTYGIESLIVQGKVFKELNKENNYNEFILTDELIDKFIEELDSLDIEL